MRISDWSADVCSSDLLIGVSSFEVAAAAASPDERAGRRTLAVLDSKRSEVFMQLFDADPAPLGDPREIALAALATRSEERSGGKDGVRTCRYRWWTDHSKKTNNQYSTYIRQPT